MTRFPYPVKKASYTGTSSTAASSSIHDSSLHVGKVNKIAKKAHPSPKLTSTKHLMAYVMVNGIENETSYHETDWPLFVVKEYNDNAYDFLNDNYDGSPKEHRKISTHVKIDNGTLRIAVRNSNVNNLPVFENFEEILDWSVWASTKRHQHRMTCGSLGDALKRTLGMGYASYTAGYDSDNSFEDPQWNEPLIVRFNGIERRAFIRVDLDNQEVKTEFDKLPFHKIDHFDTEVEIALPCKESTILLVRDRIKDYYKKYKLAKRQTEFTLVVE